MAEPTKGFRIRTISFFIGALPQDEAGWDAEIAAASSFLRTAKAAMEAAGACAARPGPPLCCSFLPWHDP